jgi:hypothetical protein
VKENCAPSKMRPKYISECYLLIVRIIYTNYAPLLDELTSISVNVHENKSMKFYDLDEIELGPSCIWLYAESAIGPL